MFCGRVGIIVLCQSFINLDLLVSYINLFLMRNSICGHQAGFCAYVAGRQVRTEAIALTSSDSSQGPSIKPL